jgi:hypothetical protein
MAEKRDKPKRLSFLDDYDRHGRLTEKTRKREENENWDANNEYVQVTRDPSNDC